MSIINKMLRDLDRRNAAGPQTVPLNQVRPVAARGAGHEWFWRIIATLMVIAVAWVGWVVYQLRPYPLVTEDAFKAAEKAKAGSAVAAAKPAAAAVAEKPAAAPALVAAPVADEAKTREPPELFRLAHAIETQIVQRAARTPAAPAAQGKAAATPSSIQKQDHMPATAQRAEAEFRRGAALLNQGRLTDAEQTFRTALEAYPRHEPSRQALVAMRIERGDLDDARRLLQEGMALNPQNLQFAMVLARIHVERRDNSQAYDVLQAVKTTGEGNADFQALLGTVEQRLGKHKEAVEAFNSALRIAPQNGPVWVAFGLSLEAIQRRPEAGEAYRRALATGTLAGELKIFAEQRAQPAR